MFGDPTRRLRRWSFLVPDVVRRLNLDPFRIAAIYTVFGFVALYLSDFFLPQYFSGGVLSRLQVLKGGVEVLMTAGLIYVLTRYSERQLQRTNRRLDRFTRTVSHDLRNPLNVLEGSLVLAERTGESVDFERCHGAIERMHRLIDDLLTLARDGSVIDDTEPVSLANAAQLAWEGVETENAGLAVEAESTVDSDGERLQQLLGNLYRNAVEHGGPNVTVAVGDLPDGFYVQDDGPGIPDAERDRVLEEGYSTANGGTGFGLSIVGRIADAHGWEMTVAESPSGGARFEFTGVEPT
jgi:signal transduction histidine kinase